MCIRLDRTLNAFRISDVRVCTWFLKFENAFPTACFTPGVSDATGHRVLLMQTQTIIIWIVVRDMSFSENKIYREFPQVGVCFFYLFTNLCIFLLHYEKKKHVKIAISFVIIRLSIYTLKKKMYKNITVYDYNIRNNTFLNNLQTNITKSINCIGILYTISI